MRRQRAAVNGARGPARRATSWGCGRVDDCFIEQAVAGLSIGLVLADLQGRVVWLNRTAERVLGVTAAECSGRTLGRVLRDPQLAEFWRESVRRNGSCMGDVSVRWPRPVDLKLNATRCVARDGREIGRALLFCDITSERIVQVKLNRELATRLLDLSGESELPAAVTQLTPQELRILRLVGRGLSTEAVGERLSVALSTVRTHVKSIYRKLGLHSRAALVSFALRHRLT